MRLKPKWHYLQKESHGDHWAKQFLICIGRYWTSVKHLWSYFLWKYALIPFHEKRSSVFCSFDEILLKLCLKLQWSPAELHWGPVQGDNPPGQERDSHRRRGLLPGQELQSESHPARSGLPDPDNEDPISSRWVRMSFKASRFVQRPRAMS